MDYYGQNPAPSVPQPPPQPAYWQPQPQPMQQLQPPQQQQPPVQYQYQPVQQCQPIYQQPGPVPNQYPPPPPQPVQYGRRSLTPLPRAHRWRGVPSRGRLVQRPLGRFNSRLWRLRPLRRTPPPDQALSQ